MTLNGHSIHEPGSGKERVIPGGKDAGEYDGVDDAACRVGSRLLKDNGKGGGVCRLVGKTGVVVGDVQANDERRQNAFEKY